MNILVIIPTYNEKDNIKNIVDNLMQFDYDILFIDDNSPDGTAQTIRTVADKSPRIKLLSRKHKMGLGSAYIDGFTYAKEHTYDKIVMMDADLSHSPLKIPELLNKNADMITGSRYVPGGSILGWPWYRYWLSKCANVYASKILPMGIHDLTSGFNAIEMVALKSLDLKTLKGEGYAFLIELKYRLWKTGFKLIEIPIVFKEREKGKSKISKKIIWEAFWLVLKLKLKY